MNCLHCGAETTNGLALCDLCQRFGTDCLAYLPIYFRNLARWRPGRAGSRDVPGSRVLWTGEVRDPDRTGDLISDALDEAKTALMTWAEVMVEARPHFTRPLTYTDAVLSGDVSDETAEDLTDRPGEHAAALCLAFAERLTSVATTDWCGEFVRDLSHHEARLRAITEESAPGWYAGRCKRCAAATYVVPGLTWVTCRGIIGYTEGIKPEPIRCGVATHAADHLETILDEARDWIAGPMQLAGAAVALIDTEQSIKRLHKRISKWGERGQIDSIRRIERTHAYDMTVDRIVVVEQSTGSARYRFGEVMDRLLSEGATRLTDDARAS